MTTIETISKIRAEIERRKNICKGVFERESDTYYQGKAVAYDETLSFLDTLEEPDTMKHKICAKCGARMKLQEDRIYTSNPPMYGYDCPKCGYVDYDLKRIEYVEEPEVVNDLTDSVKAVRLPDGRYVTEKLAKEMEEPVCEELDDAAWDCVLDSIDVNNPVLLPKYKELLLYLFKAGANWQAEQFEKNRLATCDAQTKEEYDREVEFATEIINKEHRQPTFSDAINYGMRLQKEQMMKEAVEGEIVKDMKGLYHAKSVAFVSDNSYNFGDKVRIIILPKED